MSAAPLPLVHLDLTVADVERAAAFYRTWFGFTGAPRPYPDGTVFLSNADGFDLALHPGQVPVGGASGVHFGFRAAAADVRSLRAALVAAGVTLTEAYDEEAYVNLKCLDPDGYEVEVYWEP